MKRTSVLPLCFLILFVSSLHAGNPPVEIKSPEITNKGRVSKKELLHQKRIALKGKDKEVVSFSLICTNDQLRSSTYHSNSASLTPVMVKKIKNSPEYERFILTSLIVDTPDGKVKLAPITFNLKD